MPNCDFYATIDDHKELLDWLFSERTCDVYELYSAFDTDLTKFSSASEVLAQFDRRYETGERWKSVELQLYVSGAGPAFEPRRVAVNPKFCNGATHRYAAEGWGLVQLYLSRPTQEGLDSSHTNHFTQKGAAAKAATDEARANVDSWDFKKITAFSSRLNRQIRNLSVGKLNSRPVLAGGLAIWQSGGSLRPFKTTDSSVTLHADA
ncbi:hypothetical protein [Methyloversatilis sp.]|uniref:hypothetical protein n=1 Tax=Methyloversatilis sp. TaxID=2569862 RepID=UPI0027BAF176|nr:hypothetical protein [Methyloversatilis sp.]